MQAVAIAHPTRDVRLLPLHLMAWLRRHADVLRAHIRRRRNLTALAQLDDRLLRDIGLCRSDLPYAPPR